MAEIWRKITVLIGFGLIISGMTGFGTISLAVSPVRLAYSGNIYEAPLWVAFQKGFFQEEGLDVILIQTSFDRLADRINSGQIDGTTADYRIFPSIARGLRLKLIAGLHGNCVRIIGAAGSKIKSVRDLNGKTIGVEGRGDGPMVVTSRLLRENGIDVSKQIHWKIMSGEELPAALTKGEIHAAAIWEPAKMEVFLNTNVVFSSSRNQSFFHQHNSYRHFYGSFSALSERFINQEPQKAAAVSRAWLRAAQWVGTHPAATARIILEQHYINVDSSRIRQQLSACMWMPGVRFARENIRFYIIEQEALHILHFKMDVNRFFDRVYAPIVPDLNAR